MHINEQRKLVQLVREIVQAAPLYYAQIMDYNFNYQQTGAGWGWVSGHGGPYRYEKTHPITGKMLPPIPQEFLDIAAEHGLKADAMLINYYTAGSTLRLHRDTDEKDLTAPVVSLSFGDTAKFSIGPTYTRQEVIDLTSGSVMTLAGITRLHYHGVNSIVSGSGPVGLLRNGGRINVTLRKSQ